MATICLDTIVLSVRDDPDDVLRLPVWVDSSRSPEREVIVQQGASGRVRAIGTRARKRTWDISVDYCPRCVVDWLEDHLGVPLCVRDPVGRKAFGVIDKSPSSHIKIDEDRYSVSFTVTEITHSEVV